MLKQRIYTGVILIILLLLCIFYLPAGGFALVTAFIVLLGAWEWTRLIKIVSIPWRVLYLVVTAGILWLLWQLPEMLVLALAVLSWLPLIYLVFRPAHRAILLDSKGIAYSSGVWLLATTWYSLNFIRMQPHGILTLLILILIICGADTGAYFVGRKWGKRKLAPQVSPGKSIEGVFGGMIVAIVVAAIMGLWIVNTPLQYGYFLGLALLTAMLSVVGDLFESLIKRHAGVKDSGNILPGHGGILDRVDSLMSAAPFFALGLLFLGFLGKGHV
ncbi:MAG: phosphatidate cytidylyltransferase [Gammaproteobacteria bacterium]